MRIQRKSIISGNTYEMDIDVTPEQLDRWVAGELIQNAMPNVSKTEREFLMSGMSIEEQKEFFG